MVNIPGVLQQILTLLANEGHLASEVWHRVRFCCWHSLYKRALSSGKFCILCLSSWIHLEWIKQGQGYQASRPCLSHVCWSQTLTPGVPVMWMYACWEMWKQENVALPWTSNHCICPVHGLSGRQRHEYWKYYIFTCSTPLHLNVLCNTVSLNCFFFKCAFARSLSKLGEPG